MKNRHLPTSIYPTSYQVAVKDSIFNLVGWALGNETQLEATGERWVSLPLYPTYYD